MHPDLAALIETARAVADTVRKAPRATWGREVRMGADGTPTKEVDHLAEEVVLAHAERHGWNVVSEEIGFVDRGGDRVLVADPVDGTTNASRGLPLYCVSLALGRKRLSDVDVGVVLNIPTGDVYHAVRGQGAFLNDEPIKVRPYERKGALVAPTLGKEAAQTQKAVELAKLPLTIRSFGAAALEMCFVASGGLDLYYYAPEKMRVTDIAASALIVREAGGRVLNARGVDLDMDLSLAPRTSVVAAAGPEILEAVGSVLA